MNCRKYLLIFLFSTFSSCTTEDFPAEINSKLTSSHFRLKGTKLFVQNINGFKFIPETNTFRYSDSVYFNCFSSHINFLSDFRKNDFNLFQNSENYKTISSKTFFINGYQGVYYKLLENNLYTSYFIFGDSVFENRIVGVYPESKSFDDELFKFVKNVYYDSNYKLEDTEDAKFTIDVENNGFKFMERSLNQYLYAEIDYKKYEERRVWYNYMSITQIPVLNNVEEIERMAEHMIQTQKNTSEISDVVIIQRKKIRINSVDGVNIIFKEKIDTNVVTGYMVVTSNRHTGLIFVGALHHDADSLLPLMDKIVSSIRF